MAGEDSTLLSYAQDTLQTRLQDRGSDEMLQSGEEIRAGIAAATESAEKVGARLKTVAVAIGLAGAGDLLEQGYIAISYVQSFSLFTVPDFIDWPEGWLGCLDWLHPPSRRLIWTWSLTNSPSPTERPAPRGEWRCSDAEV